MSATYIRPRSHTGTLKFVFQVEDINQSQGVDVRQVVLVTCVCVV